MRGRYTPKPAGWGTRSMPAGTGSRLVQLSLTEADLTTLTDLRRARGLPTLADAVRDCLRRQTAAEGKSGEAAERRFQVLADSCRLARGVKRQRQAAGDAGRRTRRTRWSQWMRPDDLRLVVDLMARRGLHSMSEAVRYAVRAVSGRMGEG